MQDDDACVGALCCRQDFKDMGLRTRLLMQLAQQMMALAETHNIAVVYTNQVTTKVLGNNLSQLVPALGRILAMLLLPD